MTEPSRPGRRWPGFVARVAIALGLFGFAIWSNRDPIAEVLGRPLDPAPFALGFLLYIAGVLLAYLRWFMLVRALGLPFRLVDAVRLGFIGTLFNLVLPGAVGGDVVKAAYLCREQSRKTLAGASVVIDRLIGLLGLFVLAVIAGTAWWADIDPPARRLVTTAWVATGVVTALLVVAFLPGLVRPLSRKLEGKKLGKGLGELVAMGQAYGSRPGVVGLSLVMASITHVLNVTAFYSVSAAMFPATVPGLAEHFLIVPLVLFSTAIPLPFGALGLTEKISEELFQMVAYQGGAVAMMGFRLLQYAGATIALGVYLASLRQVKELTKEAEDGPVRAPSRSAATAAAR